MGVKLQPIIVRKAISYQDLVGKIIASDAPNIIMGLFNFARKNADGTYAGLILDRTQRPIILDNIGKGYYHEILYELNMRNYDKALELISRYSRFDNSDSQIYKLKIETLKRLRKYNEALEVVNEAIKKWAKEPKSVPGDLLDKETLSKEEETEVSYLYEFCRIKALVLLSMNKQEDDYFSITININSIITYTLSITY